MYIVQLHQTIAKHDAIGNDIDKIHSITKTYGSSYVYCQYLFNDRLELVEKGFLLEIISKPNTLIIYHHSGFWQEGEELLREARCKIIFRYHNITPESFFEEYNEYYFLQCKNGREQTNRFIEEYPDSLWMSDSKFNTEDLIGVKNMCIVPPFHNVEDWKDIRPNEEILKQLIYSDEANLLFIGRVAPNKAHLEMIEVMRNYVENYDRNIKLYILGKFDEALEKYTLEIKSAIKLYGLEENIQFIGEVNDEILISYYLGCDAYLCLSNHEGFCVPVLEAQSLSLPVISKDRGALAETLGEKQIILQDNIAEYAAAIKILSQHIEYKDYIVEQGYKNYKERFCIDQMEQTFKRNLEAYVGEEK